MYLNATHSFITSLKSRIKRLNYKRFNIVNMVLRGNTTTKMLISTKGKYLIRNNEVRSNTTIIYRMQSIWFDTLIDDDNARGRLSWNKNGNDGDNTKINLTTALFFFLYDTANKVKKKKEISETLENKHGKTNPLSPLDAAKSSKNLLSLWISPGNKGGRHFFDVL